MRNHSNIDFDTRDTHLLHIYNASGLHYATGLCMKMNVETLKRRVSDKNPNEPLWTGWQPAVYEKTHDFRVKYFRQSPKFNEISFKEFRLWGLHWIIIKHFRILLEGMILFIPILRISLTRTTSRNSDFNEN